MLLSLGAQEVDSILQERPDVEVGCDYCGQQYRFDPVDAALIFRQPEQLPPSSPEVQ